MESAGKVDDILNSYNFIGVAERLNESLVVLSMILGIELNDIMYISSKRAGFAFTGDGNGNFECVHLAPKFQTPVMESYFASENWTTKNQDDILLYIRANSKLDETIQMLGKSKVQTNLRLFQSRLQEVQEACQQKTIFPCSSEGKLQLEKSNCYLRDEGKLVHDIVSLKKNVKLHANKSLFRFQRMWIFLHRRHGVWQC